MRVYKLKPSERVDKARLHQVTFETEPNTKTPEQYIARSAGAMSPYDAEVRLKLSRAERIHWAVFGRYITTRENEQRQLDIQHHDFSTPLLRRFGQLLYYYADITEEEIDKIGAQRQSDKDAAAGRLIEGEIAYRMAETIRKRISVPRLWEPAQKQAIGFSRSYVSHILPTVPEMITIDVPKLPPEITEE